MDLSNESAINEMKEIAAYHKEQLAIAEKKIKELLPDLKPLVIAFETRNAYKRGWKKVVDEGLINNVSSILEECYEYFISPVEMEDKFIGKAKNMMGKIGSLKWQNFTLEVIKYLYKSGSFYNDGEFDNFEDTAGGCDEITQDAAMDLIENSTYSSVDVNPIVNSLSPPSLPPPSLPSPALPSPSLPSPIDKDSWDYNRGLQSSSTILQI
jgi:hypothetical protein